MSNIKSNKELGQFEYDVISLAPNDVDIVYRNLYCKNNSIIDEYVTDIPILPIHKYDKTEFTRLLEQSNTFGFLLTQKVFLKNPNTPKYYYTNEKKGILCFEVNKSKKQVEIEIFETEDNNYEMYDSLLNNVCKKIVDKNKEQTKLFDIVKFEVEDGRWNQIKALTNNNFRKYKTITRGNFEGYLYIRDLC